MVEQGEAGRARSRHACERHARRCIEPGEDFSDLRHECAGGRFKIVAAGAEIGERAAVDAVPGAEYRRCREREARIDEEQRRARDPGIGRDEPVPPALAAGGAAVEASGDVGAQPGGNVVQVPLAHGELPPAREQASRLLFSAEAVDGAEAARIGLAEFFVPSPAEAAQRLAEAIAANDAVSLRTLKRGIALAATGLAADEEQDSAFDALLGSDALADRLASLRSRR